MAPWMVVVGACLILLGLVLVGAPHLIERAQRRFDRHMPALLRYGEPGAFPVRVRGLLLIVLGACLIWFGLDLLG